MKTLRRRHLVILPLAFAAFFAGLSALAADVPSVPDSGVLTTNCSLQVTVLRYSSKSLVAPDKLRDCHQPSEIWQALRKAGNVDILYHSTRSVGGDGQGAVDFVALESRPVIYLGGAGATNISHAYGTEIHLRVYAAAANAAGPPLFVIDWNGSWSGSPQLMAKWESLAVRGFNAASKIPGIAYQKTEEDDDGFVNTTSGTDVSGFFKKKAKTPVADDKATPAEPDYLDDPTFETVPLQGQSVTSPGGLVIARQPLKSADGTQELFLLISL